MYESLEKIRDCEAKVLDGPPMDSDSLLSVGSHKESCR